MAVAYRSTGGCGNEAPRLVHATRREGKQHATRATKTIHMEDKICDEVNMVAHCYKLCNYN